MTKLVQLRLRCSVRRITASATRPRGIAPLAPTNHVAYFLIPAGNGSESSMQTNPLPAIVTRDTNWTRTCVEAPHGSHSRDCITDPDYSAPKAQQLGAFRAALGAPMLRDGIADRRLHDWVARRTPRAFHK